MMGTRGGRATRFNRKYEEDRLNLIRDDYCEVN